MKREQRDEPDGIEEEHRTQVALPVHAFVSAVAAESGQQCVEARGLRMIENADHPATKNECAAGEREEIKSDLEEIGAWHEPTMKPLMQRVE
jgi:hypothetical protein